MIISFLSNKLVAGRLGFDNSEALESQIWNGVPNHENKAKGQPSHTIIERVSGQVFEKGKSA